MTHLRAAPSSTSSTGGFIGLRSAPPSFVAKNSTARSIPFDGVFATTVSGDAGLVTTKPYIVRSGDYLTAIAAAHGVTAGTVWSDPANDQLRARRPNREILAPGDVVYIPVVDREWLPVDAGAKNTYVGTPVRVSVKLLLRDELGPIENAAFTLGLARGELKGTTDGDGRLTFRCRSDADGMAAGISGDLRG